MKRLLQHAVPGVCALALACGVSDGQNHTSEDPRREVAELSATVQQLRTEVALLRRYVERFELERRRDTIRQIKIEIETLRSEQARLTEFDQTRRQDLRDIEELLISGDLTADARPELEGTRAELAITRQRELDQQSEAVRVRESELLRRLEAEKHLAKRLEEAWRLSERKTQ